MQQQPPGDPRRQHTGQRDPVVSQPLWTNGVSRASAALVAVAIARWAGHFASLKNRALGPQTPPSSRASMHGSSREPSTLTAQDSWPPALPANCVSRWCSHRRHCSRCCHQSAVRGWRVRKRWSNFPFPFQFPFADGTGIPGAPFPTFPLPSGGGGKVGKRNGLPVFPVISHQISHQSASASNLLRCTEPMTSVVTPSRARSPSAR